jgi:hypothetical protein
MSKTTFRQCALPDLETVAHFVDQLYTTDPGEVPTRPDVKLTFAEFKRHPKGQHYSLRTGRQVSRLCVVGFLLEQ